MQKFKNGYPVIGVLVGWQVYGNGRAVLLNYVATLLRGIRSAAQQHSCNLLMACGIDHTFDPAQIRPAWPIDSPDIDFLPVGPWNTDGLIVINPLLTEQCANYADQFLIDKHPTVFIGNVDRGSSISIDNSGGIRQALLHLAEHGHRRIAFIAGQPEDVDGDSRERLDAYVTAVHELGLEADSDLIAYGHHVIERSELAMNRIMARNVPFTAVLGSSDESAIGAMHALQKAGKRIPQDVAVIGFDDLPEAMLQTPPLTTIHSPTYERGQRAVDLLLTKISGTEPQQYKINVPTRLILRRSCGCTNQSALLMNRQADGRKTTFTKQVLVETIIEVIQSESRRLRRDDVQQLSHQLVDTFILCLQQADGAPFAAALEEIMDRVTAVKGNIHTWQMALSLLALALPDVLPSDCEQPEMLSKQAVGWLIQARIYLSEQMQRQYQQNKLDDRLQASHMGRLTAGLLSALDESEIFTVLQTHLPQVKIEHAVIGLFQPEEDDNVGWCYLRSTAKSTTHHPRIKTKQFPPRELFSVERPFSLALLPLVDEQRRGFVAFDSGNLALCGAILQQIVAAMKTTQLYREAQEGRELAEEANRLKSRFLSTVSHELRTPLSLIVGLSNIVLHEESNNPDLPETFRQDLERIYASAQHLDGLIRDVLDLAQSEFGQLRLSWETIDLREILQLSALVGEQLAQEKALAWQADISGEPILIRGDRIRLQQVILNLLHNAVKFTQQGAVSLAVEIGENLVTISVHDTGLGIRQDEQAVIFNEFRRTERAERGGYGGLGVGLTISRQIITLHGGDIHVDSSGIEGEGAHFYFTLPLYQKDASLAALKTEQSVLLIAEQSQNNKALLKHLQQQGIMVDPMWLEGDVDHIDLQEAGQDRLLVD